MCIYFLLEGYIGNVECGQLLPLCGWGGRTFILSIFYLSVLFDSSNSVYI